jgi:hypothetical protein
VSLISSRGWLFIVLPSGHVEWQYFNQYIPCWLAL